VTGRTLWNWEERPQGGERPPGRPGHGEEARRRALWAVAREYRLQGRGRVGWRPIAVALGEAVPVRLVQESLSAIKSAARRRERERRERARVHVEVHGRDVLWSLDATHLERDKEGNAVQAELVKDVGTTAIAGTTIGSPALGKEVAALLETTAAQRGSWPLVLSTDNGPAYGSREIADLLARNRVVHLRSLPHTPQHNAWVEQAIGELKEVCAAEEGLAAEEIPPRARAVLGEEQGLEEGLGGPSLHEEAGGNTGNMVSGEGLVGLWRARVDRACRGIASHRLRGSRGYRTAAALDEIGPRGEHLVDRGRFYEATNAARSIAVLGLEDGRCRRRAEREAILNTMERFRLITRTRGGAPISAPKPESVS
jgi:transposase InsO family protein